VILISDTHVPTLFNLVLGSWNKGRKKEEAGRRKEDGRWRMDGGWMEDEWRLEEGGREGE
jgi:hypothetical protein